MLCGTCRTPNHTSTTSVKPARVRDRAVERLRALACSRCGCLLPAPDSTDVLLAMIALLARFGLGGEGLPILPGA